MNFFRGFIVRLVWPFVETIGALLGLSRGKVQRFFIDINNTLLEKEGKTYAAKEILVLLPHCLQVSDCGIRLLRSIDKCVRCKKCSLADLCEIEEGFAVHVAIATGGTLARRIVKDLRPKCIIAVACERDLTSGIQDTFPLPVYAVTNVCPFGPCVDTTVDIDKVKSALKLFIKDFV